MTQFEINKEYVDSHVDLLKNLYPDKYIVVYSQEVVAAFDDYESAVTFALKSFGINAGFFIQKMETVPSINFVFLACF